MKSINIWDIINSVSAIDTAMNNVNFAIINRDGVKVINDYHNSKDTLYKFDVVSGNIKETHFNVNMKYVDVNKMWDAVCSMWYQLILEYVLSILLPLSTVNHASIVAYVENCDNSISLQDIESKYSILKSRLQALRDICVSFNPSYNHGNTLTWIVRTMYNGTFEGMEEEKTTVENAIKAINAQVEKDNTTINLKGLKDALSSFTSAFWQDNENDGILSYHYNCNSTMTFNILCSSRKRNVSKDGIVTYNVVTIDNIIKDTIFNMIARLQSMNKEEVDNASNEEEGRKKIKNK